MQFVDAEHRTVDADRNNFGPRIGFAYRLGQKTVLRGGAGLYYGISLAQNNWYTHPAFRKYARWYASLDGGITRFATLENPFPNGNFEPQGRKYGTLASWGFEANNDWSLSSDRFVNPETYQWNLSIQHQLTDTLLFETAYSASRGTHLPFDGTNNRNFVGRPEREKWGTAGLYDLVPNPFQSFFTGLNAVFNEPDSVYNNSSIPRINLFRPYPQFDGAFGGNLLLNANSDYHALQLRFEKRLSHGLNFVGSYTLSKLIDDSSAGMGSWLGNSTGVQDRTNLKAERSLGGSDTPQRFVFGWSYELPVGKGKGIGRQWGGVVQSVLGGWQINGFLTYQSGNPLPLYMAFGQLADGRQRPNLSGDIRGADIRTVVDGKGLRFNPSAFSDPGDQRPGNAPRLTGDVRGDSIHNLDLSVFKNLTFRETMKLQLRAEFFNFTNTPRFGFPDTNFGSPTFGTLSSQINNARRAQMGVRFLF